MGLHSPIRQWLEPGSCSSYKARSLSSSESGAWKTPGELLAFGPHELLETLEPAVSGERQPS